MESLSSWKGEKASMPLFRKKWLNMWSHYQAKKSLWSVTFLALRREPLPTHGKANMNIQIHGRKPWITQQVVGVFAWGTRPYSM